MLQELFGLTKKTPSDVIKPLVCRPIDRKPFDVLIKFESVAIFASEH